MIRDSSEKQLTLAGFGWPFQSDLNPENRWVKLAATIPWDVFASAYYESFNSRSQGRPVKISSLVIGAVIIKHKLVLSDLETVDQITENPYPQYFVGHSSFPTGKPFDPSLLV